MSLEHLAPDTEDRFEDVVTQSLYRWTVVNDIEDERRHSIALKVRSVTDWNSHDSIARRVKLSDREDADVTVTIFEDNHLESYTWEPGRWYFFRDLEGDIYEGDTYLTPTSDAKIERIDKEDVPG